MLGVMIIDDDRDIREWLEYFIDWDGLGVDLTCEAADSETAMELYLIHRPKIVITDISIPIISGLELANELSTLDSEIRFIVITGYNDFEYVRDSVALGAVDLLSKPLTAETINNSLRKAIDYFKDLRNSQTSVQLLTRLVEDNLPQLQEGYIASLLTNHSHNDMETPEERLNALRLDIAGEYYAVAVFTCDSTGLRANETDMLLAATRNVTEELLDEARFKHFVFYDDNFRLICVVSWNSPHGEEKLEEVAVKVYEKIAFSFERKVYAGIGQSVSSLLELSTSARQAHEAYNYQGVIGSDSVVNYKNVKRLDAPFETNRKWVLDIIEKQFRMNMADDLHDRLQSHFVTILATAADPLQYAKAFAFEYVALIISVSLSLGVSVPELTGVLSGLVAYDDIPALTKYIWEFTEKLMLDIFNQRSHNKNVLIRLTKEYIGENIGISDLDLNSVSYHIGLSSIYLCRLFHKEEGVSFNQYVTEQKVGRAKDMLKTTGKKVYEISDELGFGNPKYFSFVFKRNTGMSPMEYRKS